MSVFPTKKEMVMSGLRVVLASATVGILWWHVGVSNRHAVPLNLHNVLCHLPLSKAGKKKQASHRIGLNICKQSRKCKGKLPGRYTIHPPEQQGNTKCCQGQGLLELPCIASESRNDTTPLGKDLQVSSKTKHSPSLSSSSSDPWYLLSKTIASVHKRLVPECLQQLYS